jgi:TPR repeat protein
MARLIRVLAGVAMLCSVASIEIEDLIRKIHEREDLCLGQRKCLDLIRRFRSSDLIVDDGDPNAVHQRTLGDIYADLNRHVEKHRKAAEQGDAEAQTTLGALHLGGVGVKEDHKQAYSLFLKAAEQGFAQAQKNLGDMYHGELYHYFLKQDHKQAASWYRKAAEQGHADAQNNLGIYLLHLYNRGEGVRQGHNQAALWYRKAAEQGHAGAQVNLADLYRIGIGVDQDHEQALFWASKAAAQGNIHAVGLEDHLRGQGFLGGLNFIFLFIAKVLDMDFFIAKVWIWTGVGLVLGATHYGYRFLVRLWAWVEYRCHVQAAPEERERGG